MLGLTIGALEIDRLLSTAECGAEIAADEAGDDMTGLVAEGTGATTDEEAGPGPEGTEAGEADVIAPDVDNADIAREDGGETNVLAGADAKEIEELVCNTDELIPDGGAGEALEFGFAGGNDVASDEIPAELETAEPPDGANEAAAEVDDSNAAGELSTEADVGNADAAEGSLDLAVETSGGPEEGGGMAGALDGVSGTAVTTGDGSAEDGAKDGGNIGTTAGVDVNTQSWIVMVSCTVTVTAELTPAGTDPLEPGGPLPPGPLPGVALPEGTLMVVVIRAPEPAVLAVRVAEPRPSLLSGIPPEAPEPDSDD